MFLDATRYRDVTVVTRSAQTPHSTSMMQEPSPIRRKQWSAQFLRRLKVSTLVIYGPARIDGNESGMNAQIAVHVPQMDQAPTSPPESIARGAPC